MKKLNLKRLLQKRNNGGFTLVEVVISCALLSILVIGVFSFVSPVMSMINTGKKSSRATLLAESINSYISSALTSANMVAVYENAIETDGRLTPDGSTFMLKHKTADNSGLWAIDKFMREGDNANKYEVHCIGIRFLENSKNPGTSKLMVTNELVYSVFPSGNQNEAMWLKNSTKIFDDVMYDGLYPVVNLSTFSADASTSGSTDKARGYCITTKVYGDDKIYSSMVSEQNKSYLAFTGTSYVKCMNMHVPAEEPFSTNNSVVDAYKDLYGYDGSTGYKYFAPDTYIYYVVPVSKPY